jgi:sec-independent protein translocase protein TatB
MSLGVPEMLFIFLLALLIFGPRKLPEIGRQFGRTMAEFKRASNEFKNQIEDEVRQLEVEEAIKKGEAVPVEEDRIQPPLTAPAGTMSSGSASGNGSAEEPHA